MIPFFQDFVTKHQIDMLHSESIYIHYIQSIIHIIFFPSHMMSIYYKGT